MLRFDIEANGYNEVAIKDGVVIKEATKVHVMWVMDDFDESLTCYKGDTLAEGVKRLWAAEVIGGHNIAQYDVPILERITGLKKPASCRVRDTLIICRFLWPIVWKSPAGGHELGEWGKLLGVHKGDFNGPWDRWTQEMEDYCKQDVVVQAAIEDYVTDLMRPWAQQVGIEHAVTAIIARQTAFGWGFNVGVAEASIKELEIDRAKIQDELTSAFPPTEEVMKTPAYYRLSDQWELEPDADFLTKGAAKAEAGRLARANGCSASRWEIHPGPLKIKRHPFNPNSPDQIVARLTAKYQWKPTSFTDGGKPKADYDALVKLPYPEAKVLLKWADNDKLMEALVDYVQRATSSRDGRIHGSVNPQGCTTGRMSHKQPNSGNVPKDKRVRSAFISGLPGRVVVGIDASGLELRMLSNRMWAWDQGAYAKIILEDDVHTTHMEILREIVPEIDRDHTKTWFYGWLYGSGDEKAGKIVEKDEATGARMKAIFFQRIPAIKKLIDSILAELHQTGFITLLDGRRIPCESEHAALNYKLQGDGAIVMKAALLILDKELQRLGYRPGPLPTDDYEFMGNIHDEWQIAVGSSHAEEVGKLGVWAIKRAGEVLKVLCPLDGEYKIGQNWSETH